MKIASRSNEVASWRGYTGLALFLLAAVSIPIGYRFLNGQHGEEYHRQLLREFRSIDPPPNAFVVQTIDHYSSWSPHQAIVGESYRTNESFTFVRQHYDKELNARAWRRLDERGISGWGRDFGGRLVEYCKGPLKASLQYAGPQADYGWTFGFELSDGDIGFPRCR